MLSRPANSRSIPLFFVATFLYWTSMYVYVPILSVHAENLGASMALVGTIVGVYGLAQFLFRVPLGVWSDRIGLRKPFILAGLAAACVGALGLGLSTDPLWLVVWRAMTGLGAAAWVAFTVLFSSYFPPEKAPRAMSQVTFISAFGQMTSTYAGGLIAQQWGWNAPFYVGVVLALLAVAAAMMLDEKPMAAKRQTTVHELWRIGTVPLLLAVSMVAMLGSWTQWATVNGFTLVYAAQLGATRADLGMLTTVMQLGYTLATLVSGFLAERMGARATAMVGLGIQAAGAMVVPMAGTLPLVALTQVMGGAGRGLSYPLLMGLSIRSVRPADRATAMGVFQAVYALGMFAGPASTGVIGDALGMTAIFVVAGVASVVGVLVIAAKVPAKSS